MKPLVNIQQLIQQACKQHDMTVLEACVVLDRLVFSESDPASTRSTWSES